MPHFLPISAALITAACTMSSMATVSTDDFVEPITPGTADGFGVSVAIGDSFFVVGAPNDDDAFSNAGSVTVYFVDPATGAPSFSVLEVPATLNASASFGYVVAADGDTFVVAAPAHHDLSASPVGAVYVYTVGSVSVSLDAVLQPSPLVPVDLDRTERRAERLRRHTEPFGSAVMRRTEDYERLYVLVRVFGQRIGRTVRRVAAFR